MNPATQIKKIPIAEIPDIIAGPVIVTKNNNEVNEHAKTIAISAPANRDCFCNFFPTTKLVNIAAGIEAHAPANAATYQSIAKCVAAVFVMATDNNPLLKVTKIKVSGNRIRSRNANTTSAVQKIAMRITGNIVVTSFA